MNEIFSFRKELNIKKIIIVVLIILIIIGLIICKVLFPSEKTEVIKSNPESPNSSFYSEDKKISLSLSKSYNFIQYKPTNNYLLELRNDNNLNIFITEEKPLENQTLSKIVSADLTYYTSQFNNVANISNISEFDRGGTPAYTYSFHYLDSKTNTEYYLQTIWIEYNENYYILDVEFPLKTLNENSKIINDILNSIIIN